MRVGSPEKGSALMGSASDCVLPRVQSGPLGEFDPGLPVGDVDPQAIQSPEASAIVYDDGTLEELIDGIGVRYLRTQAEIVAYARALLSTTHELVRFIWIDRSGIWRSIALLAQTDRRGQRCTMVRMSEIAAPFELTKRELDVLTLLAAGYTNQQIGASLGSSPRTAAKQVENILAKVHLSSRAAAAGMAVDRGVLRLPIPGGRAATTLAIGEVEAVMSEARGAPRLASVPTKRPIYIGAPRMNVGLGRYDADEMYRGASLAIDEINGGGGIDGRRLELLAVDCDINDAGSLNRAYRTFLDAEVDAITTGYSGAEAQLQNLMSDYGCPYLHASTSEMLVQRVREDPTRYSNVFQVCPSDIHYGPALARFIEEYDQRGPWRPPNRRVLAITTDAWMGLDFGVPELGFMLSKRGWQLDEIGGLDPGNVDWTKVMREVHRIEPAVIFLGFAFPTASMSFHRAFLAAPTQSLVYMMYSPSIPVFRQELGPMADGVLWSTTTGLYSDAIGSGFARRYREQYGMWPGRSHAGIAYDRVRLLANAWSRTGNSRAFKRVSEELRSFVHRGVNGSYFLGNAGQSTLAYGGQSADPSISQAHLVFQVQSGRQRILSPQPYVDGAFQLPWWFSGQGG
jgi:branched-chain amino acid transport system substrate-binding protein